MAKQIVMDESGPKRCGAWEEANGMLRWRVWAPRARHVELISYTGDCWRAVGMHAEGAGYFTHHGQGTQGQRYAYRLDGGAERPDPCSLWQPDGVHRPSAVYFPGRLRWTDQDWTGVRREDLVFYELHVGTFTSEGTFDAVVPRLPALRELGITAIEVMPVAQFPGGRNWGYDGVHLYAPQSTYGGPEGLARLVDACHAQGLAVFLDVVYNHLGPEGNYAGEFGPYFTDRYHTSWGPALNYDGPDCDPVRRFVLDNVRLWLEDYHFDGLRLDATHAIFDASPRHVLREIKEVADEIAARTGKPRLIVPESLRNDVRGLLPPEQGGCGLDAEWNEDLHHALLAYLTGERQGKYVDFGQPAQLVKALNQTFVLDGVYSRYRRRRWGAPVGDLPGDRFVVGVQNHDHVGNRARGERIAILLPPAAVRLTASLVLLSPYLPLLFMGEEYGEEAPFPFFCSFEDRQLIENVRRGRRRDYQLQGEVPDVQAETTFQSARLSWSWPEGTSRAGLRRLYHDLLAARRCWPALRDFKHRHARLLPDAANGPVLELVRGVGEQSIVACFNLTSQPAPLPGVVPTGHAVMFSSEVAIYQGGRTDKSALDHLLPYECLVLGR